MTTLPQDPAEAPGRAPGALGARNVSRRPDGVFASGRGEGANQADADGGNLHFHHPRTRRRFPAAILTPEDVAAILGQCSVTSWSGIRDRALLTLFYRSGLRISEALAIRPADVDARHRVIRLLDTKSGEAQTRGYHPLADDTLARWSELRKSMGLRGPLFCTRRGTPIYPQQVRNLMKRLAARAGVDKRVHPHAWRHAFAAELERSGEPVTVISALLGHSDVAVTARYLRHLTNNQAITALQNARLPELEN